MLQNILVKVGADISDFSAKMQKAGNDLEEFSKETQAGFDAVGKAGKLVTAGGLALAGGLGYAVKTSADFEKSMSRVGALSGATDKEMQQLTDTALELGRTTSFTASEAAAGMSFLSMAGYETNEILSSMPGLLSMAAAGQSELGATADIASNIMQGFNIEASEMGRVSDVLTKAFTSSNVTLEMLGSENCPVVEKFAA